MCLTLVPDALLSAKAPHSRRVMLNVASAMRIKSPFYQLRQAVFGSTARRQR